MGLMVKFIFLVLQVCAIVGSLFLQLSSGQEISPSAANFSAVPPVTERSPQEQTIINSPSPTSQQNASPHFASAPPAPQEIKGLEPSLSPNTLANESRPSKDPVSPPRDAAPTRSTSEGSQPNPPVMQPPLPLSTPPIPEQEGPDVEAPVSPPILPVNIAPPPKELLQPPPSIPEVPPPMLQVPPSMPQGPPPMPQEAPPMPQEAPPMPQEPPSVPQVPPPMSPLPPEMPQEPPSVP